MKERKSEKIESPVVSGRLPGRHRRLLRIFALASLGSVLVILALAGFGLNAIYERHILDQAEDDALHLTQVLLQHDFDRFFPPPGNETNRRQRPSLDPDRMERLASFHILKIKVFGPTGEIRFSNDLNIIGDIDRDNAELKRALAGEKISTLERKGEAWDLKNEIQYDVDVVETYVPIVDAEGRIEGALEIYLDVTRYAEARERIMTMAMILLATVLILVFGSLFAMMRTATRLLYAREEEIQVLSGLLPICSYCKKIRNSREEWESLESYISARSRSNFTHSICPECFHQHCPDDADRDGE